MRIVVTIARSLHRQGVRCVVAAPRGQALRVSSRAIARCVPLDGDINEAVGRLCRLALSEQVTWVVPTNDASLQMVCAAYDELSRLCAVGSPPPHIVQRTLATNAMLATAARCGVPVPLSITIRSASELDAALGQLRFPIIAQPADRNCKATHRFKTQSFANADKLRAAFATDPRFGEGLLFQTSGRGQRVGIDVLISKGEMIASFQHSRVAAYHSSNRHTVVEVAEPVDSVMLDHSVRLLRALEWEGVAMVGFRRDSATGKAALTDVHGHFCGCLPLASAAGMDFPLYAWQLSQGITPTPLPSYRYGLRVRCRADSLMRAVDVFAQGPDERPSLARATRQLLADFAPGTRSAMWSWVDPVPALQEVGHAVSRRTRDALTHTLRRVIPAALIETAKASRSLPGDRRASYLKRRFWRMVGGERAVVLPRPISSVLFVCHGNIMRSAAAAEFLRDELHAAGIADVKVASAGTYARDGRPADTRAQEAVRRLGASLTDHRATLLSAKLVANADVIFAMDELNLVDILTTIPDSRRKLMLFGGMSPSGTYRPHEIADPYLAAGAEVTATIEMIRRYVAALAQAIADQRGGAATIAQSPAGPRRDARART